MGPYGYEVTNVKAWTGDGELNGINAKIVFGQVAVYGVSQLDLPPYCIRVLEPMVTHN